MIQAYMIQVVTLERDYLYISRNSFLVLFWTKMLNNPKKSLPCLKATNHIAFFLMKNFPFISKPSRPI